jgi:hypothetical protein
MNTKQVEQMIWAGQFSEADLDGLTPADVAEIKSANGVEQRRFMLCKAFGVDGDERRVKGAVHSTEERDASGDRIMLKGWTFDRFKDNPQIFFDHGHRFGALPVALGEKARIGKSVTGVDALLIDEKFHTADMNPQAELIWRMVSATPSALPGRSVGFSVTKKPVFPDSDEDRKAMGLGPYGVLFDGTELFESSVVSLPDNAGALQGRSYSGLKEEAERAAREVTKKAVEDGVISWGDAMKLADSLPLTEEDAEKVERQEKRSTVQVDGLAGEIRSCLESSSSFAPDTNTLVVAGTTTGALVPVPDDRVDKALQAMKELTEAHAEVMRDFRDLACKLIEANQELMNTLLAEREGRGQARPSASKRAEEEYGKLIKEDLHERLGDLVRRA